MVCGTGHRTSGFFFVGRETAAWRPAREEAVEVPTGKMCALCGDRRWRVVRSDLHHWRKVGSVDALGARQPGLWLRICTGLYSVHYITINTLLQ